MSILHAYTLTAPFQTSQSVQYYASYVLIITVSLYLATHHSASQLGNVRSQTVSSDATIDGLTCYRRYLPYSRLKSYTKRIPLVSGLVMHAQPIIIVPSAFHLSLHRDRSPTSIASRFLLWIHLPST